jgi:outer membrane receptor protein involved in Fe transport
MNPSSACRRSLLLVFSFPFASFTLAQTAPALPPPASPAPLALPDQPVVLETFTVNTERDRGYIAVDALAGGRTNTPIKLTPASMSSLTRTFLNDLGIQDVREALRWSVNVVPSDPLAGKGFAGQAFHAWSYNFRGAGAGQQGGPGPTRNYFSFFENPDSYNIDRVEFTRGPNSILFGLGTVGGTLSTYTKVARLDKAFFSPAVIADDNQSLRFEADYNLPVNDKLAVRVNALYDDHRGWRNGDELEKRAVDLALLYKFTSATSLRVELEGAKNEQLLVSSNLGDKLSGWDGTTASATWGAAPTGGTARTGPMAGAGAWGDWLSQFWVYVPNLSGNQQLMRWAGGYASTNSRVDVGSALNFAPRAGWYPEQIKLPGETTYSSTANLPLRPSREWTYGHGLSNTDFETITAFLDHRFNRKLDLQLGFYRFTHDQTAKDYEGTGGAAIDINRQLPDGSPNPNFGQAFADFFLSQQRQSRTVNEARAQLNFKHEGRLFGAGWTQLFGLSAAQRETTISARQYLGQIGNGTSLTNPADWVQNMVWGRIYLDRPNQIMAAPEFVNGRQIAYLPKADGYWFDFDDEFDLTSYALFSHTRLFDDRLSIALGARQDSYDERLLELRRGPNLSDRISEESDDGMTYTAGGVYYFGWLGVFANYSQNILPPNAGSQPYLSGARPAPEKGEGYDYGLRVSTGDGKYYATLSRYDTTSEGRNVENPVDLRGLWQKYNIARGVNADSGLGSAAYSDTTSLDVSGYEFEVTANPTRNLRLQATYGRPDTKVIDFYPMTRAHVAENLAAWNAQVGATASSTAAADLRNAIASVQDKLAQSTEGSPQQGSVDYTASIFAHYTFDREWLKGWSFGAGAAYTGQSYQATYDGVRYFGNSVRNVHGVLAYETTIGRTKARFALNVENIFDYDEPIVTGYHWGYADASGRHIRDGYYFQEPRTFRLSARFTF